MKILTWKSIKPLGLLLAAGALAAGLSVSPKASAQEPFLGEIMMFGGNFAIRGWTLCDGQLLPISSNTALFSILGTTYGGDGRTTFGLPDLRGRSAVHVGTGPGLTQVAAARVSAPRTHPVRRQPARARTQRQLS